MPIDTGKPHPARMYDWYLGGKGNHPVDEEMGRRMPALEPRVPVMTTVNRAFMHRATRRPAGHGVRRFLDIGTGIPTEPNLHQVAQQVAPDAAGRAGPGAGRRRHPGLRGGGAQAVTAP